MVRVGLKGCTVSRPAFPMSRAVLVGGLLLAVGLTVSACGRKGPLDAPPASFAGPQPGDLETDAEGRPIAPTGPKRRILLDSLLD
jgi:predicted small lipoprotein YifL